MGLNENMMLFTFLLILKNAWAQVVHSSILWTPRVQIASRISFRDSADGAFGVVARKWRKLVGAKHVKGKQHTLSGIEIHLSCTRLSLMSTNL